MKTLFKFFILISLGGGIASALQAADSPREKLLLNLNWKFSNGSSRR